MLEFEIDTFTRLAQGRLHRDPGYAAVQTLPGIGPILAAVLVAEIGDISRFDRPEQLTSWAGLTPRHRESDTTTTKVRLSTLQLGEQFSYTFDLGDNWTHLLHGRALPDRPSRRTRTGA